MISQPLLNHWQVKGGYMGIDKKQAQEIKKSILECMTTDSENNQAIFDKDEGFSYFGGTDLSMVMDKVVKGIYKCVK